MERLVLIWLAFGEAVALLLMWMVVIMQYYRKRKLEHSNRELRKRLKDSRGRGAKAAACYELRCFIMEQKAEEQEQKLKDKDTLLKQKWAGATAHMEKGEEV